MTTKRKRAAKKSNRRIQTAAASPHCSEPDCGRPSYVRGLCQTHHRQLITTGKTQPIRPYRRRTAGTVKFSGLRLSQRCAEVLGRDARRRGLSRNAVIAEVLEAWHTTVKDEEDAGEAS
jgi:hypothetical protein